MPGFQNIPRSAQIKFNRAQSNLIGAVKALRETSIAATQPLFFPNSSPPASPRARSNASAPRLEAKPPQPSDQSVDHGICAGLTAMWITQRKKGEEYWSYLDTRSGKVTAQQYQRLLEAPERAYAASLGAQCGPELGADKTGRYNEDRVRLAIDLEQAANSPNRRSLRQMHLASMVDGLTPLIAKQTGMKAGERITPKDNPHGSLGDALTRGEGYFTTTIRYHEPGEKKKARAHEIGAFVNGDRVIFMDPNFGEADFADKKEFATWFDTRFVKETYGELFDYRVQWFPHSTDPDRKKDLGVRSPKEEYRETGQRRGGRVDAGELRKLLDEQAETKPEASEPASPPAPKNG